MIEHFSRLFEYNRWANEEVLKTLQTNNLQEARELLSHILIADRLWFARLSGNPTPSGGLTDGLDLPTLVRHISESDTNWKTYLHEKGNKVSEFVTYQNSQGEQRNTISDILTHLVNHGTHHRAQINRLLRQTGVKPPVLDFIYFARLH